MPKVLVQASRALDSVPFPLKVQVDIAAIENRKKEFRDRHLAIPYMKQKSALEKEVVSFLGNFSPARDVVQRRRKTY